MCNSTKLGSLNVVNQFPGGISSSLSSSTSHVQRLDDISRKGLVKGESGIRSVSETDQVPAPSHAV